MTRSTDISPLSVLLARVDAAADGAPPRDSVGSGFPSIDKILGGGFRPGDLIVLGGDVGSGKSALALAMALRASEHHRAMLFSGEMWPERIHERILAIEGRTRIDDLRRGILDDITRVGVGAAAVRLRDSLPIIDRMPGSVAALAAEVAATPGVELVVVDSMQSLARGSAPLAEQMASIVQDLKALALDSRVAILTTTPLSDLASRSDPRPTLDDFGALDAVKHHADVVLALYREEMYHPAPHITGATELHIRKNRNGITGYVDLYFYTQWLRFEDMLDPDR
jgi:replicative DNA helicase